MFNINTGRNKESSISSKQNIKASLSYFSKFSKRSRQQQRNDKLDKEVGEEEEGGFRTANRQQDDNKNDKNGSNARLNTSSGSSSGYMSGFKPMHHITTPTNRPYTSQQHFYHFGGSIGNGTHDYTGQLVSDNSNGVDVNSIIDVGDNETRRLPNRVRRFTDNHQQQARFLPQSNLNRIQGGQNQVRASMMVPMMIEGNNYLVGGSDDDENVVGNVGRHESGSIGSNAIGAAVIGTDDVDGVDLIDDDIGENLDGQRPDGNNYNSSTCYSENRLRSLHSARLHRSRDCALDPSSMSVVDQSSHHHQHHHQDSYEPRQEQQLRQLQYLIPIPAHPAQYTRKQYFHGATSKSFAPLQSLHNPTSSYSKYHDDTNEDPDSSLQHSTTTYHQPISAIYQQPNIPNYQQQYHSFSYLQPQQQLHQLQQQYPGSLIERSLNGAPNNRLASSTIHLLPNSSSQLESTSAAGESTNSSSTATGAPIDSRLVLQPTSKSRKSSKSRKTKTNSRMQSSRQQQQHLNSDISHHHHLHPHHQQQSSKRKLQNVGSRKKAHHNAINSNINASGRQTSEKPGLSCCAKMAKLLLFITNVTFWVSLDFGNSKIIHLRK